MYLHEFINMIYNFDRLWNFLCDKEVVRKEILCPRCENVLTLTNVRENHIFHCTKHYYKVSKTRKRQRVILKLVRSMELGLNEHLELPTICQFIAYFVRVGGGESRR